MNMFRWLRKEIDIRDIALAYMMITLVAMMGLTAWCYYLHNQMKALQHGVAMSIDGLMNHKQHIEALEKRGR